MLDVQTAPAAPPVTIRREDYRPPDWRVTDLSLDFELDPERTIVRATLSVERNGEHREPLRLDGEDLVLTDIKVDGQWVEHDYTADVLTVPIEGDAATVETVVEISPNATPS